MNQLAWLDCPYGRINDPFPGLCPLYTDTNANQICDHSESAPGSLDSVPPSGRSAPFFWAIFLPLVIYLIYWFLTFRRKRKGKNYWLNQSVFRYFWNLVLLFFFLGTAITSLLLLSGGPNRGLVFWHTLLGTVFLVVSLLHLLGRAGYYLKPPKKT